MGKKQLYFDGELDPINEFDETEYRESVGIICSESECGTFISERADAVKLPYGWVCADCAYQLEQLPSDQYWNQSVGTDEWIDKGWTPEGDDYENND